MGIKFSLFPGELTWISVFENIMYQKDVMSKFLHVTGPLKKRLGMKSSLTNENPSNSS